MTFNINIFNFNSPSSNVSNSGSNDINADFFGRFSPVSLKNVNDVYGDFLTSLGDLVESFENRFQGGQGIMAGGCLPPAFEDASHPEGSMKADGGVITTPGGYKIEPMSQFEWKITGPDGKETRIWGDPHVAEGDGGTWDFKRNSTFVLGDGTRVNVTTAPYGDKGMTVTQGLEVISGNERVTVSGIDKGKGVVGQVTQDGYEHVNTFGGNDVFVMGKESDDWAYQGKEIVGSNNGGESFKTGNSLAPGSTPTRPAAGNSFAERIHDLVDKIINGWDQNWRPNQYGRNPYYNGLSNRTDARENSYDRRQHQNNMRESFKLVGNLLRVLGRLSDLQSQMYAGRSRTIAG